MSELELPPRIWNLDAETLAECDFDRASILMHAQIEFDEDVDRAEQTAAKLLARPAELAGLLEKLRERHARHWPEYARG